MNALAHIFITLILIQLMHLTGLNIFLAFLFGVLIDLDHVLRFPAYFKKYGFRYVKNFYFRTFVQEPVMLVIIVPLCFIINNFVPLIFFASHLLLDYLMEYEKKPFGFLAAYTVRGFVKSFSKTELAITLGLMVIYLAQTFL
jgi:hypothetical protein